MSDVKRYWSSTEGMREARGAPGDIQGAWVRVEDYDRVASYAGEATQVLEAMVAEYTDYAIRNHLGNPEKQHNIKWARIVLAKNPNPADHAVSEHAAATAPVSTEDSSTRREPSGAGGAGTRSEFETRKKPDYSRAYWGQPGDPYPWIVREPSGQCWGPFDTNEAAGKWADDNKIDTCDFEDVMPPPELRHQSGKKPLDYEAMASAFSAWISSRPAGYEGDEPVNSGNRWFDAFAAGVRWRGDLPHQVGRNVDVRREALLDAAKAVCPACAEGRPVEWQEDGTPNWWHENRECRAGAIHELRHVANR